MIDFTKLETPSPEQNERAEKARHDREIAADLARRTERAHKTILLTCAEDARHSFAFSGTRFLSIHGTKPGGQSVSATWYAPDHATDQDIGEVLSLLTPGSTLELRGYWKPHQNREGKTCITFIAQFIQPTSRAAERRPPTSPQDQMKAFG